MEQETVDPSSTPVDSVVSLTHLPPGVILVGGLVCIVIMLVCLFWLFQRGNSNKTNRTAGPGMTTIQNRRVDSGGSVKKTTDKNFR